MAHGKVHAFGCQVHQPGGGADMHIHLRGGLQKILQPGHQPLRGKHRCATDQQHLALVAQLGRGALQCRQGFLAAGQQHAPGVRQHQTACLAFKQALAHKIFQLAQLLRNGTGRDMQLLGRPRGAAVAGRGFKTADGGQRWQVHGDI